MIAHILSDRRQRSLSEPVMVTHRSSSNCMKYRGCKPAHAGGPQQHRTVKPTVSEASALSCEEALSRGSESSLTGTGWGGCSTGSLFSRGFTTGLSSAPPSLGPSESLPFNTTAYRLQSSDPCPSEQPIPAAVSLLAPLTCDACQYQRLVVRAR